MIIATATIKLHAPWVHSLKEKRMELKSLISKIRNKFNVSVCETSDQEIHQILGITIAAVTANSAQADSITDNIINFIEQNTQAQIVSIERDRR